MLLTSTGLVIMGYGFSIDGNKADAFALALATSNSKNVRCMREEERKTMHQQEGSIIRAERIMTGSKIKDPLDETTFESITSSDSSPLCIDELGHGKTAHASSKIFHLRAPTGEALSSINQDLLDILSIMAANQRELTSVHITSARSWIRHLDGQLTHNIVTVASRLLGFLRQQHAKIIEHNDDLPPSPQNVKQFHAARYRRFQLHILQSIMLTLKNFLTDVVYEKHRVAHLEDILSDSPPTFGPQFRAALHYTLGTRKAQKLREAGYQDLVFTVWVCTLWLCYVNEDMGAVRKNTISRFHKHVFDWLIFLRASYCSPPGWGDNTCSRTGCAIHQWITTDDDEAMEERAIVESYLEIVQLAAEANPASLYADSRWNADFLRWGYRVVQEEGFVCPNLDDDHGSEDDEFMLFFEDDSKGEV